MKKLTLNLEHLKVESFETDRAPGSRGTVQANSGSLEPTGRGVCNPTLITGCLTCPIDCTADGTCHQLQCGSN
jgi:hypothetical protein